MKSWLRVRTRSALVRCFCGFVQQPQCRCRTCFLQRRGNDGAVDVMSFWASFKMSFDLTVLFLDSLGCLIDSPGGRLWIFLECHGGLLTMMVFN